MRILVVVTNPDYVTKAGGAGVRRDKLISLLSHSNDVIFLNALGAGVKGSDLGSIGNNTCRIYYFKQWFIFGKCLSMFSDLNINLLSKMKRIVGRENVDLICITEPYGIISTSLICSRTPVVYDSLGVVSDHAKLYVQRLEMDFKVVRVPLISKIVEWLLLNYTHLLERLACQKAKHIIAISEVDKQRFIQRYHIDEAKITAIPVWIAVDDFNKIPSKQKQSVESNKINIIFHGSYGHPANYEAFNLIENYIAPMVKKHSDNIQFLLVGTDLPQFERGNLKSLGFVEDFFAILRDSDIAIVPVLQGTGMKVKILDYMAAGLPIITTEQAVKGIEVENGKHAIILDAVDDNFIEAILSLATDKQRREMLGKNALGLVKERYNRENIQGKLDKMLIKIKGETKS